MCGTLFLIDRTMKSFRFHVIYLEAICDLPSRIYRQLNKSTEKLSKKKTLLTDVCHEKPGFLPMGKQRRRSASQ